MILLKIIIKNFEITVAIYPKFVYDKKDIIGDPFGSYVKLFKNIINQNLYFFSYISVILMTKQNKFMLN